MFIFMNSTDTTTHTTTYTVTKTPGRRWKVSADGVALTETYTTKGEAEAAADVMRLDDEADRAAAAEVAAEQAAPYVLDGPAATDIEPGTPLPAGIVTDAEGMVEMAEATRIAAMSHDERIAAARVELAQVRATGLRAAKVPTPVIDWMTDPANAVATAPAKARTTGTRAPRGTIATFEPGDDTTHECSCCHTVKPVKAFPTVNGPAVRAERCRSCRDGKACE